MILKFFLKCLTMKTLLSITMLIFSLQLQAQNARHAPEYGIKGGFNFATLNADGGGDINTRTAIHAGLLAHLHLTKMLAIQPEVLYSGQGAKFPNDRTDRYNYLNIPVNLQYMFDNGFRIQTGPQIGLLLGAESQTGDVETDVKDFVKPFDFSWTAGVGFLFPNGFGVDARYNFGIIDIWEPNDKRLRNNVLQAGVFYQFMHNRNR